MHPRNSQNPSARTNPRCCFCLNKKSLLSHLKKKHSKNVQLREKCFWALRNCLVCNCPLIAISPINWWLLCTAHWGGGRGVGWVLETSWAPGLGSACSPFSLLPAAPVTTLAQSQSFLFCEHLVTVQQQVEKRGTKPDLFSHPHAFQIWLCQMFKILQL